MSEENTEGNSKQSAEQPKDQIVLPAWDGPASAFHDKETGNYWIVMPTKKQDYLSLSAILDKCKYELLCIYQQRALLEARIRLEKPGTIAGLFDKTKRLFKARS